MSVEYPASMPMGCFDCVLVDMNPENPCQDQGCKSVAHSCQSNSSANYLPVSAVAESALIEQIGNPGRSDALAPQDLTDPIYRPPIS